MKKRFMMMLLGVALVLPACSGKPEIAGIASSQQEGRPMENADMEQSGAAGQSSSEAVQGNGTETTTGDTNTTGANAAQQEEALKQFLNGTEAAAVDSSFVDLTQMFELNYSAGKSYTIDQLIEEIRKADEYQMLGDKDPVISYAMLQNGPAEKGDVTGMAVAIDFVGEYETNRFIYILKSGNEGAQITLGIDAWTRRWTTVNPYGVVSESGSGGAAYHGGMTYVPKGFVYSELEQWTEVGAGYTLDNYEGEKLDKVNAIINECMERAETDERFYQVVFGQNKIGDQIYYTSYAEDEAVKQQVADMAAKQQLTFDEIADVDAAREELAKRLGAEAIYKNDTEVNWIQR